MKYRVTTFLTFSGLRSIVESGDHDYGEWIIYDGELPKFHLAIFGQDSPSDKLLKELLDNKNRTIETILDQININEGLRLNFGRRPSIELIISTTSKDLQLAEIPLNWLEKLLDNG